MSQSLRHTILEELNVSGRTSPGAVAWKEFGQKEWKQSLDWLDVSGLALYFRNKVQMARALHTLPLGARLRLDRSYAENRTRLNMMADELKGLCRLFEEAGVDYALLKGIALVPDYCPDASLRSQYDHDVLVPTCSLERADGALRKAGYQRRNCEGSHHIVYVQAEPNIRPARKPVGLYSSHLRRAVEVHVRPWEFTEEKIGVEVPGDLLVRAVHRRWNELEYHGLGAEDSLLFQAVHAFRHILANWCRLSVFLEIAHFLNSRHTDAVFWQRFATRISGQAWLPEICGVVFQLAACVFGAPIPRDIEKHTISSLTPAMSLWVERYGRISALANFCGDKYNLFLHREFVRASAEWPEIRRRKLFPIRRPHRPPAVVYQRGASSVGKVWMESLHALRRLIFHISTDFDYVIESGRWWHIRRERKSRTSRDIQGRPHHVALVRSTQIEGS